MSSIYVLRHAQSQGNVNPSLYQTMFNPDIPLSEEGEAETLKAAELIKNDAGSFAGIYSSPYRRTLQTAEIIRKVLGVGKRHVKQNIFLADRQYGEQEGCNDVDDFNARPTERHAYEQAGHLAYTPIRGESLLDVQMRVALFIFQHDSFRFIPSVIIVSHVSTCLMFHAYFTGEIPTRESKWKNCEIRKYTADPSLQFTYEGILQ